METSPSRALSSADDYSPLLSRPTRARAMSASEAALRSGTFHRVALLCRRDVAGDQWPARRCIGRRGDPAEQLQRVLPRSLRDQEKRLGRRRTPRRAELKGKKCFANRSFRARAAGRSKLLDAAEEVFDTLDKYGARPFVIWTAEPALVSLRSARTTELSKAYKGLLFDFRALMRGAATNRLGSLNFDQRDLRSDEAANLRAPELPRPDPWRLGPLPADRAELHRQRGESRAASCGPGRSSRRA